MCGPQAVSEATLCRRILERLGPPAVILADRNFGIFSVAYAATQSGHDVVFRLKDDRWERMVAAAVPASGAWSGGPAAGTGKPTPICRPTPWSAGG